jgi:hypothetical protein
MTTFWVVMVCLGLALDRPLLAKLLLLGVLAL